MLVIRENQQLFCRHNHTHTHVRTAKGPAAGRTAWSLLGASPPWGLPSCAPACLAAALRPCSPAPRELRLYSGAWRCPVLAGSRASSGLRAWPQAQIISRFFFLPRAPTVSCQSTSSCLAAAGDKGRTSNSSLPLRNTNTPFTFSHVQGLPMLPGN